MPPSQRRRKGGDRLSALPDNALERVLSHLASGEAVRSSVLSRRWRRVHEGVPVVNLVDPKTGNRRSSINDLPVCFDHTVTSAIMSKGAETPIRTFRLQAFQPPYDLLDQWIATVATSGVEDLDVKLGYNQSSSHTLCPFGWSRGASADFDQSDMNRYTNTHRQIFGCPTLRRLRLTNWTLDLPASVNMASLETLCLKRIMDPEGELQKLISGCPSLAHLTLEQCPGIQYIAVTSPRLRSFAMICCHNARSVELHSTCVQSLHYKGGLPSRESPFFTIANFTFPCVHQWPSVAASSQGSCVALIASHTSASRAACPPITPSGQSRPCLSTQSTSRNCRSFLWVQSLQRQRRMSSQIQKLSQKTALSMMVSSIAPGCPRICGGHTSDAWNTISRESTLQSTEEGLSKRCLQGFCSQGLSLKLLIYAELNATKVCLK